LLSAVKITKNLIEVSEKRKTIVTKMFYFSKTDGEYPACIAN